MMSQYNIYITWFLDIRISTCSLLQIASNKWITCVIFDLLDLLYYTIVDRKYILVAQFNWQLMHLINYYVQNACYFKFGLTNNQTLLYPCDHKFC